jgi:ribosome-associated protein
MSLEPLEKAIEAARVADSKGALDLVVLDMQPVMALCDYFMICHGRSKQHCQSIVEALEDHLSQQGIPLAHIEGFADATWIILDCLDLVIHVFSEEARVFYDLRRLWGVADEVTLPAFE